MRVQVWQKDGPFERERDVMANYEFQGKVACSVVSSYRDKEVQLRLSWSDTNYTFTLDKEAAFALANQLLEVRSSALTVGRYPSGKFVGGPYDGEAVLERFPIISVDLQRIDLGFEHAGLGYYGKTVDANWLFVPAPCKPDPNQVGSGKPYAKWSGLFRKMGHISLPTSVQESKSEAVCECGAVKANTTHANWCPKYS